MDKRQQPSTAAGQDLTPQIYETIEEVRKFSNTMVRTSPRRKRLQKAIELLDNEVKTLQEEDFVNEVLALARNRFGNNIASSRVSEMIATAGTAVETRKQNEIEFARQLQNMGKECDNRKIAVKQYTLEGKYVATYSSVNEAARAVSISATSISGALSGNTLSSAGFIWKRADDTKPVIPCVIKTVNYPRPVGQYNLSGELVNKFSSISKAAKAIGVCGATMHKVLDKDTLLKNCKWRTLE